jgi:hypothetical protein
MEPVTQPGVHDYLSVFNTDLTGGVGIDPPESFSASVLSVSQRTGPKPHNKEISTRWLVDENGTWVPDIRAGFVETELWGAMDCIIKLDHKMCTKFGKQYRTWFAMGRDEFPGRSVQEFVPRQPFLNPQDSDYFVGTVLAADTEAGTWVQRDVELARREVIHYMQQPALPFTDSPTGAETGETDLTGLRGERMYSQRLVLRGLKMMARNYWLEALSRFVWPLGTEKNMRFADMAPLVRKREKLKFKMRRVMRKLCQRLEILSMLMAHPPAGSEIDPPHRESLDYRPNRLQNKNSKTVSYEVMRRMEQHLDRLNGK